MFAFSPGVHVTIVRKRPAFIPASLRASSTEQLASQRLGTTYSRVQLVIATIRPLRIVNVCWPNPSLLSPGTIPPLELFGRTIN
jgi:hypothetical protein